MRNLDKIHKYHKAMLVSTSQNSTGYAKLITQHVKNISNEVCKVTTLKKERDTSKLIEIAYKAIAIDELNQIEYILRDFFMTSSFISRQLLRIIQTLTTLLQEADRFYSCSKDLKN